MWTRRRFLVQAGLGSVAWMAGACGQEPSPSKPGVDLGSDLGMDLGPDLADMGQLPADMADMSAWVSPVSKRPWVHLNGPSGATLRFETLIETPLDVRVELVSGVMGQEHKPSVSTQQVDYDFPLGSFKRRVQHPDLPGRLTVQEVKLQGLRPGERYRWIVDQGQGQELRGEFLAAKPREEGLRLGWISDTMDLHVGGPLEQLQAAKPDLLIHGGDFQYMTSPMDTWNGMFRRFSDLQAQCAMHMCIGNHEYEEQDEFEVQYKRLLSGQGQEGGTLDYHAQEFGPALFILLNSEIELASPDSAQHRWMLAQLERARQRGLIPIVAFHRPYFTFSRSRPSFQTRDALHPVFVQHQVPIVFTGHNHCYERFEVDGMVYVMDGGGGALSYNPDDKRDDVLAERPSDEPLRKIALREYGCSTLDVRPDGTMTFTRTNADGQQAEQLTLSRT